MTLHKFILLSEPYRAVASFSQHGISGQVEFLEVNQQYVQITVNVSGVSKEDPPYNWEIRSLPVSDAASPDCSDHSLGEL